MRLSVGFGAILLAFMGLVPIHAAQAVIVLRASGTGWSIIEAEKITFNRKEKLRIVAGQGTEIRADDYKRLGQQEILHTGTLRQHAGGYLVRDDGGVWVPVTADGATVKAPVSFASLWAATTVSIQSERNSKTFTELEPKEIYAIIPGSDANESLADLIVNPANFQGLGESTEDAAFEERMSLLVWAARKVSGPGASKLQNVLITEMVEDEKHLSSGIAERMYLDRGLKYVEVSKDAYPDDPQQKAARDALLSREQWLHQRYYILKALWAGELWDAFLAKYSDFARWDNSFEDMRKSRAAAFENSGKQHYLAARRYSADKNFAMALREATIAQRNFPSDPNIADFLGTATLGAETETALKRVKVAEDKNSSAYQNVTQHLQMAEFAMNENNLKDAKEELDKARLTSPDSPRVLFSTAKYLLAGRELKKAFDTINEYFKQVVKTDGDPGVELRSKITYELKKSIQQQKDSALKAKTAGDYSAALTFSTDGLKLDDSDLDFLLGAGLNSAVLRKREAAAGYLEKFITLSQAPGADQNRLADAYKAQTEVHKPAVRQPEGKPNWFSGYANPQGLTYCPISLMISAHVLTVKAKKQTSSYQWNGEQLESVRTTSQDPLDGASQVFFSYFKDFGSVRMVSLDEPKRGDVAKGDQAPARITEKSTAGPGSSVYVALLNHPEIDPLMIQRLNGKPIATLASGNPYFHPFVWNGTLYTFIAEYDDEGRVKSARQVSPAEANSRTLDFTWDGWKLKEISERGGAYKRTLTYAGNNLVEETVSFHGKVSKIRYKFKGDQITEARCDEDPSIDSRSRDVTFR